MKKLLLIITLVLAMTATAFADTDPPEEKAADAASADASVSTEAPADESIEAEEQTDPEENPALAKGEESEDSSVNMAKTGDEVAANPNNGPKVNSEGVPKASAATAAPTVTCKPVTEGIYVEAKNCKGSSLSLAISTDVLYKLRCDAKLTNGAAKKTIRNLVPGLEYTVSWQDDSDWRWHDIKVKVPTSNSHTAYTDTTTLGNQIYKDYLNGKNNIYWLKTPGKVNASVLYPLAWNNKGKKIGGYLADRSNPNIHIEYDTNAKIGGKYVGRVTTDIRSNSYANAATNKKVLKKVHTVIHKTLAKKLKGKSKKEKCKIIMAWLAKNCSYGRKGTGQSADTAYGALIQKKAWCNGYAQAYMLLCDEAGINTTVISGTISGNGHAWVLQEIEGKLYASDPTFADIGKSYNPNKLLRGTSDKKFNKNRKWSKSNNADKFYGISTKLSKKSR